jgi:hypothetical protein
VPPVVPGWPPPELVGGAPTPPTGMLLPLPPRPAPPPGCTGVEPGAAPPAPLPALAPVPASAAPQGQGPGVLFAWHIATAVVPFGQLHATVCPAVQLVAAPSGAPVFGPPELEHAVATNSTHAPHALHEGTHRFSLMVCSPSLACRAVPDRGSRPSDRPRVVAFHANPKLTCSTRALMPTRALDHCQ